MAEDETQQPQLVVPPGIKLWVVLHHVAHDAHLVRMLDEQIANLDSIMNQARVIPHYRQGKPVGFKVVGIRSNSIFRHLGLKSGDVLKSVGGEELTSINKALGLFEKLKTSDNVSLDVERLGKGQTLDYTIK